MSTLRERIEELYDWAIVPVDAECYLEPCEFDMLMRWQETHTLDDGPCVLTVDKLPDTSEESLAELQRFAYDRVSRIPTFNPPDDSEYAWAYDIFFYSAREYIRFDTEMQLGEYQRTGKLDKRIDPPPYFFPNDEVRNEAMSGRCFVCVKPGHVGERVLPPDLFFTVRNGGRVCKACRNSSHTPAILSMTVEQWQQRFPDTVHTPVENDFVNTHEFHKAMTIHTERKRSRARELYRARTRKTYQTAEDWVQDHPDTNPKPKEDEFPDPDQFQTALAIHTQRRKDSKKARNQRPDVKERKNAQARTAYAERVGHTDDEDGDAA